MSEKIDILVLKLIIHRSTFCRSTLLIVAFIIISILITLFNHNNCHDHTLVSAIILKLI